MYITIWYEINHFNASLFWNIKFDSVQILGLFCVNTVISRYWTISNIASFYVFFHINFTAVH